MTLTTKPVSELSDFERTLLLVIPRRDFTQDNVAWVSFDMPEEEIQVEPEPASAPEVPVIVEEVAPVESEPTVEEGIPAEALVPTPSEEA